MRKVIDQEFIAPRLPVNIVALPNSDNEAHAVRAVLEALGCVVTIHWIGTPTDFLKVLGQGETAPPYLLISGHGDDEKGYYLGEYAEFIDTSMLHEHYMPAEVITPIVNLPGCTVISSACGGGAEAMGHAFVQAGKINAYIGCRVYPNANDMVVYLVNFFHSLLEKKLSDHNAWQRAMVVTDQPDIYKISFFHADGTEDRYKQNAEAFTEKDTP